MGVRCSFCGKLNTEVDYMIVKNEDDNLCICSECVLLCQEIIDYS